MTLDAKLAEAQPEILEEAFAALSSLHVTHYESEGGRLTRQRLADLFALVVAAIRTRDLAAVVAYSQSVAVERFNAGFGVAEVQTAFNTLETAMWRHVVSTSAPDELAESIGLLSTVLGAGKDALAREYVSLASQRHVPSLDLSALFRGTNS